MRADADADGEREWMGIARPSASATDGSASAADARPRPSHGWEGEEGRGKRRWIAMSELAREDESSEWDWTRCRHISQSAVSQSASRSVISWSALAWYVLLLELAARYPSYRMLPSSKASFTLVSDLAHGTSHFLGLSRSTSPFQSNRSRTVKINRGCKFQLRPRRAAVLQSSQVPISRSNSGSGSGLGESILFWRIERLSV